MVNTIKQVIPIMPEEICIQDGDKKEDCEVNAFKRFIDKFFKDHNKLEVIVNGDALYASMPVIEKIHKYNANYTFKVKPASHKTLIKNGVLPVSLRDKNKQNIIGTSIAI